MIKTLNFQKMQEQHLKNICPSAVNALTLAYAMIRSTTFSPLSTGRTVSRRMVQFFTFFTVEVEEMPYLTLFPLRRKIGGSL
jgi:hypothetical protein